MKHTVVLALISLFLLPACQGRIVGEDESPQETDVVSDDEPRFCEDDFDCPERATCRGGVCEDVGAGCVTKSECSAEHVCVEGACVPPPATCSSSEECPGSLACDGFSRECFDPNASGCQSAGDCMLEPGCGDGCTCEGNGTCAPVTTTEPDTGSGEEPPPPPPSSGNSIDLGGFVLENREHEPATQMGVLPSGLTLSAGQRLVIGRDADRASFESYWGVTLGDDVVYLNAEAGNAGVPIINGGERWAVVSPVGTAVDGTTIAGGQNHSYRRLSGGSAGDLNSWSEAAADEAAPGQGTLPSSGVGLVVSQWSDAPGSGAYVYEFVELYYAP